MGRDIFQDQEWKDYAHNHETRTRGAVLRSSQSAGYYEDMSLHSAGPSNFQCRGGGVPYRRPNSMPKKIPIPQEFLKNNGGCHRPGIQHPLCCTILPLLLLIFFSYIIYSTIDIVWILGSVYGFIFYPGIERTGCDESGPALTKEVVNQMICNMIAKYDADKTGQPDLALESGGGKVISTRDTKFSNTKSSGVTFFGVPILKEPNSATFPIQPEVVPGSCWEFEGTGNLVIKLVAPAVITGFSVEHLPKANSPTQDVHSAPKNIAVMGLKDPDNLSTAHSFGEYVYEDNGDALQHFKPVSSSPELFQFVEFKIMTNHGGVTTCLYRVRVHGFSKRAGEDCNPVPMTSATQPPKIIPEIEKNPNSEDDCYHSQ